MGIATVPVMLRRTYNHPLWRFLLGFFFQTVPGAVLTPLLTLGLAARGVEAWLIGGLISAGSLAYMLALPAAPALIRRFGEQRVFRAALALGTLAVAGLALITTPAMLVLLFALAGFTAGLRFTLAESWVPVMAPAAARGRAMALFQTSVGAALFAGAGSLLLTGVHGAAPRSAVLATALIGLVLLWPLSAPARPPTNSTHSPPADAGLRGALVQVGTLVLGAALLGGLFESGLSVALPLYGLATGLGSSVAVGVVTAMGLGSLLQYPYGALADRFPWRSVALGTTAVIVASTLLLLAVPAAPWLLLPLGVVWGSAGGGLYTLATIRNGAQWRGERLIAASVVTQFAYMVGDASGPAMGGLVLDLAPGFGLPALVIGAGLAGLALIAATGDEARQAARPLPADG